MLYLAAIDPRKGVEEILVAYESIKKKYNDEILLVMAGAPWIVYEERYKDLVNQTPDEVIWTGFVSEREKRVLMSSAELYLFPSEYEGFGLPVIEAMACGCPVITSDCTSLPEVGGDAALYVKNINAEEIAEKMEILLEDEALRKQCIKKGLYRTDEFTWDRTARLTEEAYERALVFADR